jgi:hypothetical protein
MTLLTQCDLQPYRVTDPLDYGDFADVRRRLMLDWCKWDPQVGDVSTIAPFALVLQHQEWRTLARWAEELADEMLAAERELLPRADLSDKLGLPVRLRRALHAPGIIPAGPRAIRFDFHWTTDGWRISEANSDVPGGYAESGPLAAMMQEHLAETTTAGDPGARYAESIARCAGGKPVALISAAGFMEDHQVVAHLARQLRDIGVGAFPATVSQLHWNNGVASLLHNPLGAIVRFFQAEWLATLRADAHWKNYFSHSQTPITNCAAAILTESKRFPLVWDELETKMTRWRSLLPETRDARDVNWRDGDNWILKTALCNNGDTVTSPGMIKQWRRARWSAWW